MITKKRFISLLLCLAILASLLLSSSGCAIKVQAANLMEGVKANTVIGKALDDDFIGSSADFAVKLFQKSTTENENSLISPLSVMLALSMTANGADSTTKAQMETLLGGDIPLDTLNEYLYTYINSLPSNDKAKLKIANSVWFRDDENRLTVQQSFLQKNADYYGASAYKSSFDSQTLGDINNWVKQNTDGMIDKILDNISSDVVMYLINALVFDAEWDIVYNKDDICGGTFTALDGRKQSAEMMCSSESKYLDDGKATGFIKSYKNGGYSLAVLLPNKDVDINDYIASLSGVEFIKTIRNAKSALVEVRLPKFSYECTVSMSRQLQALGMPEAFDPSTADFSKLGHSEQGNIFISEVLHKTFISVDELGTKAGAVTKVEMTKNSILAEDYRVNIDRPFVYAVVDEATGLPIFIGAVMRLQ